MVLGKNRDHFSPINNTDSKKYAYFFLTKLLMVVKDGDLHKC